jgi:hypothetical protein
MRLQTIEAESFACWSGLDELLCCSYQNILFIEYWAAIGG